MKWTYVGIVNGDIIAFHDDKDIISKYLTNYKDTNPSDVVCSARMKKKDAKEDSKYSRYYLVRCNDTYVQSEYEDILISITPDYIVKKELIKKLKRLLKNTKKDSDKIVLLEAIQIVEFNKKRCGTYTPSLRVLREEYWRVQEYKNRMYYDL